MTLLLIITNRHILLGSVLACRYPHSTVILKEYFENIPLKSCNIAKIFMKLLERFLKY